MVGQTIEARSPFPIVSGILFGIAVALAACTAVTGNMHSLIAAAFPICVGLGLWWGQPRHVVLTVENDGLRSLGSPHKIYFNDVISVALAGREIGQEAITFPVGVVEIQYVNGRLVVPSKMNVDPANFYRFVISQVPAQPIRPLHPDLAEYESTQVAKFGRERISVIQTRRSLENRWRKRRRRWVCAGIFLTAIVWVAAGIMVLSTHKRADEYGVWIGLGSTLVAVAFIGLLLQASASDSQAERFIAKTPDACIVIGPAGLAMVQGEIRGALRWDEILNVTTKIAQSFRAGRINGMQLKVRGGEIVVLDIYERSPAELAQLMKNNLDHQPA